MLTWACREDFRNRLEDFDLFIYAEDDVLISPAAIAGWIACREKLRRDGSIPGFLRVELDRKERLVTFDFFWKKQQMVR